MTEPTPPNRSLAQRRAALARANAVRSARADLKVRLGAERTTDRAVAVLAEDTDGIIDPDHVATMRVRDLLMAIPGMGRRRVDRLMVALYISPSKTIGGLTDRQRGELIEQLRRRPTYRGPLPTPTPRRTAA